MDDKPIVYADIPYFDQFWEYVVQLEPVDMGNYLFIGNEIRTIDPLDESEELDYASNYAPWAEELLNAMQEDLRI